MAIRWYLLYKYIFKIFCKCFRKRYWIILPITSFPHLKRNDRKNKTVRHCSWIKTVKFGNWRFYICHKIFLPLGHRNRFAFVRSRATSLIGTDPWSPKKISPLDTCLKEQNQNAKAFPVAACLGFDVVSQ